MNLLIKWSTTPAKWYQFWLPQSGFLGGAILGLVFDAFVIGILLCQH